MAWERLLSDYSEGIFSTVRPGSSCPLWGLYRCIQFSEQRGQSIQGAAVVSILHAIACKLLVG
eukprot:SAG31_NODE_597_length_13674_cov_3.402947_15_plen_63_part_00